MGINYSNDLNVESCSISYANDMDYFRMVVRFLEISNCETGSLEI